MNTMSLWGLIICGGVLTLWLRMSFLFWGKYLRLPLWAVRVLGYMPLIVLSVLIAPAVFYDPGYVNDLQLSLPRILAAGLAIVVARRTSSTLFTVSVGMGSLWLLNWLLGV